MSLSKRSYPSVLFSIVALMLTLSGSAFAKKHDNSNFPNIKIKNFGQIDDRFYRGGQPQERDYKDLAALGVHTVIDLREDPENYEKRDVEALGMRYINLPMSDKDYPRNGEAEAFMKIVNDPSTGKFFVHCAGGRHRTGVMGAVYRFNVYHWNFDQAYAEMEDYDFYTRWGHGNMKKFVQDYAQHAQNGLAVGAATAATKQ
ncbi:MAG: tyrosine-protein phosphatase [Pyrinomonadaceae bacterium]